MALGHNPPPARVTEAAELVGWLPSTQFDPDDPGEDIVVEYLGEAEFGSFDPEPASAAGDDDSDDPDFVSWHHGSKLS